MEAFIHYSLAAVAVVFVIAHITTYPLTVLASGFLTFKCFDGHPLYLFIVFCILAAIIHDPKRTAIALGIGVISAKVFKSK